MPLPSSTVENYLKAIFQAQLHLPRKTDMVPMGQLASTLGVVPGTATTMMKALSESGLVKYEPYAGVRLTAAGEKLAAMVVRRHRLIELFLVKVMGMSWTEVHDEAENLEHAVSDRLVDRMDEMLGRPAADPHGDPIPDARGVLERQPFDTLLTCPLGARMVISRVTDQDAEFLRFVERRDLKPGDVVAVEERDPASDSVRLRARNDREVTIGTGAASKVLVRAVQVLLMAVAALFGTVGTARAQAAAPKPEPFAITDNSFLVEEAFNQEARVFQNIFNAIRLNDAWNFSFTQEWPLGSERHQFSYTVTFGDLASDKGFGDTMLNYRWQAMTEGPGRPAFSPRLSVVMPTGSQDKGLGGGSAGLQFNLPFSKQRNDVYWHWNVGGTWLPSAEGDTFVPFLAGSGIYRLRPMLNLMLESAVTLNDGAFTLSPGVRGGWNLGEKQIVVGFAVPTTWNKGSSTGAFLYFSYELPF
jgi:DtxR family Mn-dependent transcriptional regulator